MQATPTNIFAQALETKSFMDQTILDANDILVIDLKTGCHFVGTKLIHTDACLCGEER